MPEVQTSSPTHEEPQTAVSSSSNASAHEIPLDVYRVAMEGLPCAIIFVDESGTIRMINRETERVFDYDRSELLGQPIEVLIPQQFRKAHVSYRDKYCANPELRPMGTGLDLHGLTKNGEHVPIEICLTPVKCANYTYVCASVVDITDRKQAESIIQYSNETLENVNKELEQYVYTASHDLKSPIVTIQGFIGHLRRDIEQGKTDRLEQFLDRIESASIRMRNHIDDLLELSRIGRLSQPPELIETYKLAHDLIEDLTDEIEKKNIEVVIDESLPRIHAGRMSMEQIFGNLINNAFKYGCTAGQPQVDIGCKTVGEEIHIYIRDNGNGIAAEYQPKIFMLFERLEKESEGSGVGLAIVRRAAETYGGRAWVESELGHGATFWVAFSRQILSGPLTS